MSSVPHSTIPGHTPVRLVALWEQMVRCRFSQCPGLAGDRLFSLGERRGDILARFQILLRGFGRDAFFLTCGRPPHTVVLTGEVPFSSKMRVASVVDGIRPPCVPISFFSAAARSARSPRSRMTSASTRCARTFSRRSLSSETEIRRMRSANSF